MSPKRCQPMKMGELQVTLNNSQLVLIRLRLDFKARSYCNFKATHSTHTLMTQCKMKFTYQSQHVAKL